MLDIYIIIYDIRKISHIKTFAARRIKRNFFYTIDVIDPYTLILRINVDVRWLGIIRFRYLYSRMTSIFEFEYSYSQTEQDTSIGFHRLVKCWRRRAFTLTQSPLVARLSGRLFQRIARFSQQPVSRFFSRLSYTVRAWSLGGLSNAIDIGKRGKTDVTGAR